MPSASRRTPPSLRARAASSRRSSISPTSTSPTSRRRERLVVIAATWGEGEPPGARRPRLCRADGRRRRRGSTASPSACWRSATPPMRSSAPSARRSTRGSPSSAASASLDRVDCDLDFEAPAATWIKGALEALAPAHESRPATSSRSISRARRGARSSREPVRGRGRRARQPELVALRQGDGPSRARLRRRGAGLRAGRFARALSRRTIRRSSMRCSPRRVCRQTTRLRSALTHERDITTLSLPTLEKFVAATGHARVAARCSTRAAREPGSRAASSSISLEAFPASLAAGAAHGADAAAAAARLFDRLLAQGGRRRGASPRLGRALRDATAARAPASPRPSLRTA